MRTRRYRSRRDHANRRQTRPRLDVLEARALLAAILVTTPADTIDPLDDALSLREAIEVSNGNLAVISALSPLEQALVSGPLGRSAPNFIDFALPPGDTTISPTSALPTIIRPVSINGYSQAGALYNPPEQPDVFMADLKVQIDGHPLALLDPSTEVHGLDVRAANCTISGLIVTGFTGAGVKISGGDSQGNWLYGNIIGTLPQPVTGRDFVTDPTLSNGLAGVLIESSNNRVGGSNPGLRNVIANNAIGVSIRTPDGTGNLIQNNFILDNTTVGVLVQSSNNTIGEALVGGGNTIAGNHEQGVLITGGPDVQGNNVLGNLIGTDLGLALGFGARPKGVDARPNWLEGVRIDNSPKNTIGGYSTAARNVVGGNLGDGIVITGPASIGNRLLNNWVGFNIVTNLVSLFIPNQNGVVVESAGNFVGDSLPGGGNTISNNRGHGLLIVGSGVPDALPNTVQGNVIGLNPNGGSAFGNALDGIHLDGVTNTLIGGPTAGARNVVSSNNNGIVIVGSGSTGNRIQGNFIGTAGDGLTDLGNAVDGISIVDSALNTIGGPGAGEGNVVSGNNRGVRISGALALNNKVQGNFIGTDLTGTAVINNEIDGVFIGDGASSTDVGGTEAGAGNTIAFNAGAGVLVDSGTDNAIRGNSIHHNHGLGIVLNAANDANGNQPAPALSAVAPAPGSVSVQGSLDAAPFTTYSIEVFSSADQDPTKFGEGQTFLGRFDVTTDAAGHASIVRNVPGTVPADLFVTATATHADHGTSAFSNAMPAKPVQVQWAAATYTVNESAGTILVSVSRTGGTGGAVAVDYATGGGTAVPGTDYTSVHGTLYFGPGETTKSFNVPLLDPNRVGGQATFDLTLSNPANGATLGAPATSTVTIVFDNLATVGLAASGYTVNENAGKITVTVVRNTPLGTASVDYATFDGTAHAGLNYTAAAGTLTFQPGETVKTFDVPILVDHALTGALNFGLVLSHPVGAAIDPAAIFRTAVVVDTDAPGALRFAAGSVAAEPGASTVELTVQRTGGDGGTVTVVYAASGGTAVAGPDYTPVIGTLVFGPGETSKTISVPIANNTAPGASSTFQVVLSNPGGGAVLGPVATSTVTIRRPGASTGPGGGASGDHTPPRILSIVPITSGAGITGLAITFSEAMDPVRASDVRNYAAFVTTPGRDGRLGNRDDGSVAVAGVVYDPATLRAVLTFRSTLALRTSYRIVLNRDAGVVPGRGLADLAGNLLDGAGTGRTTGSPYTATFSAGATSPPTTPPTRNQPSVFPSIRRIPRRAPRI